jgi:hypothetical protein
VPNLAQLIALGNECGRIRGRINRSLAGKTAAMSRADLTAVNERLDEIGCLFALVGTES